MYKSYFQVASMVVLSLLVLLVYQYRAHAEEVDPTPAPTPAEGTVQVQDQQLVGIQETLDAILEQLAEEPAEDAPAAEVPDYSGQLTRIESTLSKVEQNTQPSTPETAQSAFEKPFAEYSVVEVLVLLFVVGVVAVAFFKFAWKGWF